MMNFIWIYNPEADLDKYFAMLSELGCEAVIANPVMYDNGDFLSRTKRSGLKIGLNFPVFDNGEYLGDNPDSYTITAEGRKAAIDWQNYVCPTNGEHIEIQISKLKHLLKKINPDYVSLDFIRFFTFWEKVKPEYSLLEIEDGCYCKDCIDLLEMDYDIELKDKNPEWIKRNYIDKLGDFRVSHITNLVSRFVDIIQGFNPEIQMMMKVVPWMDRDFGGARVKLLGQDYSRLKDYIDIFMPMTYMHTIGFPSEKIGEIIREAKELSGKDILPLIQVEKIYDEDFLSNGDFLSVIETAYGEGIKGIGFFRYELLAGDEERYNLLKEMINKLS